MTELTKYRDLPEHARAMVDSEQPQVRLEAARRGWGLDRLVRDADSSVLAAVACHGYGLDVLASSDVAEVADAVAGYLDGAGIGMFEWLATRVDLYSEPLNGPVPYAELDDSERALVDSDRVSTRVEAARNGLGLDRLVHDGAREVLVAVAERGYGLDLLAQSGVPAVRKAVSDWLRGPEPALERWVASNPERCALPENRRPPSPTPQAPATPEADRGLAGKPRGQSEPAPSRAKSI